MVKLSLIGNVTLPHQVKQQSKPSESYIGALHNTEIHINYDVRHEGL